MVIVLFFRRSAKLKPYFKSGVSAKMVFLSGRRSLDFFVSTVITLDISFNSLPSFNAGSFHMSSPSDMQFYEKLIGDGNGLCDPSLNLQSPPVPLLQHLGVLTMKEWLSYHFCWVLKWF